jgi:RNA polymerase sigma-70 factor (ECF subfamily)
VNGEGDRKGYAVAEIPIFEDLVERHQAEIFGYIIRMVRHDGEAQDLCQETFLRAYRAFDRLEGCPNYRAWLYKIATNTTLNHIRQRRTGDRTMALIANHQPTVHTEDPVERLDHDQLLSKVHCAIEKLPPKQRAAFTQRKFLGSSYEEIAARLDCSEETARAHVYQAAQKLRKRFSEELKEVGI